MTTLPFPAPLLLLLPAGSTCSPLHVPRPPAMLGGTTPTSIACDCAQSVSTDAGVDTNPTYTVMFLHGSNSHRVPGLEITAGLCTYILGRGQCLDDQEEETQGQEYHVILSIRISGEGDPINIQSRQSRGLGTPTVSAPLCLLLSLTQKGLACPCRSPVCSVSLLFISLIGRCLTGGNLTLAVSPEPCLAGSKSYREGTDTGKGF